MRTLQLTAMVISIASLAGCGSLSGFDANSSFACKAPSGVLCESMTGIYANAEQKNLPGQRVNTGKNDTTGTATVPQATTGEVSRAKAEGVLTKPIYSGTPIRSAPRVLRVWFAPWEDTDGDLHDQSYVYLPIDSGRWLIEHNRRRIQDAYRPVHAPKNSPDLSSAPTSAVSSVQAGAAQGMETIGTVQGRPSEQDVAAMLRGIKTPSGVQPQ